MNTWSEATGTAEDRVQPPAQGKLPLGWRLALSTALIVGVVMGAISARQQFVDIQKEQKTHRELLEISLAPLAARLESVETLERMQAVVDEFHEAHLSKGYPEHNVILTGTNGEQVLSTVSADGSTAGGESFRAELPIRSSLLEGGRGTLVVLKSNNNYREGVRRDWILWSIHFIDTLVVASLFIGVAVYVQVTKPINRLIKGVRKMERGYRGSVDPGGAWEIRWLAWRFDNMARELRNSATRLSRAERKAWSLMSRQRTDGVSRRFRARPARNGRPRESMVSPLRRELEAVCERLEQSSFGDSEAVELAHRVRGGLALDADRLGYHDLKARMEDAALRLSEPDTFASLAQCLDELRADWGSWAAQQRDVMLETLERRGIPCTRILHRVKHTAGVHAKMHGKELNVDEVYDLFAFRIVVPTEADCYTALGAIHHVYQAEISRFKDYISEPKENGYQGLHTCVKSNDAPLFEIQIRSEVMDSQAERGEAAHWQYKALNSPPDKGSITRNRLSRCWHAAIDRIVH